MATGAEIDENGDTKGNMWVLEQKLDQPMDEEAGRLKNMYREKVRFNSVNLSTSQLMVLAICFTGVILINI